MQGKQLQPPTTVLVAGVEKADVKPRLDETFSVQTESFSELPLGKVNQERRVDVVAIGQLHKEKVKELLESDPSRYRSSVSIGLITEEKSKTHSTPFDGFIALPAFGEEMARDMMHLARITEVKRKQSELYYVTRTLAEAKTGEATQHTERLQERKNELEEDVDQLVSQVCEYDPYALFDAAVTAADGRREDIEPIV
jgi:hypothetical protein